MNLTNLPMSLDEVPLPSSLPPVILTVFTRPDLLKEVLKGLTQQILSRRLEFVKLFMTHSPFSLKKTRRRLGL